MPEKITFKITIDHLHISNLILKLYVFIHFFMNYIMNYNNLLNLSVPDEGYMSYLMKVTCHTWWRLHVVPDEGYLSYLMKVTCRTWWRLHVVPDEGYMSYLMKVTCRTWWRLHVVPDEGYMSCTLNLISTFLLYTYIFSIISAKFSSCYN
jgi:hypothetical protein